MKLKMMAPALCMAAVLVLQLSAQVAKLKVLHNFGSTGDGSIPYGPLLPDSKGNLYGVTIDGGTGECSGYGCGVVFELSLNANGMWREKILHSFAGGSDGSGPWGGLLADSKGNLYATLQGQPGVKVSGIFELSPGTGVWSDLTLYDGYAGPGLLFDKVGNLYGSIGPGDYFELGAIGELSKGSSGWSYTQLYSYCGQSGGCPGG